jgi:hypothetical protein
MQTPLYWGGCVAFVAAMLTWIEVPGNTGTESEESGCRGSKRLCGSADTHCGTIKDRR